MSVTRNSDRCPYACAISRNASTINKIALAAMRTLPRRVGAAVPITSAAMNTAADKRLIGTSAAGPTDPRLAGYSRPIQMLAAIATERAPTRRGHSPVAGRASPAIASAESGTIKSTNPAIPLMTISAQRICCTRTSVKARFRDQRIGSSQFSKTCFMRAPPSSELFEPPPPPQPLSSPSSSTGSGGEGV